MKTSVLSVSLASKPLLSTIVEMGRNLHRAYHPFVPYDARFKARVLSRSLLEHSGCIFLAQAHGESVGYVFGFLTGDAVPNGKVFKINEIYVTPSRRRAGVARLLVQEACSWARRHGAVEIHVHYDPRRRVVRAFWKSQGFTPTATKAVKATTGDQ
jgi:GNAT superfamily N-acetyltransferase